MEEPLTDALAADGSEPVASLPGVEEAQQAIEQLLRFGSARGLFEPLDEPFTRNALLELFQLNEPLEQPKASEDAAAGASVAAPASALPALAVLLDYGAAIGLLPDNTTTWRDLLDARIMGLLLARPSAIADKFAALTGAKGIKRATDWFYRYCQDANYIRMDRIRNNVSWAHRTSYGTLDMTINLSKPEKDPKEIALLKTLPPSRYPKCLLCADNVGYAGRADHPARQNLRIVPVNLQGETWYFQYSPYVYYTEHSIVLHSEHVPMRISVETFERLLDFVEQYPHYFIGSNADLPIVGGSILNHDHFQAGRHTFAMETAAVEDSFAAAEVPGVTFHIVAWPMSVVRLRGADRSSVLAGASRLLDAWRAYSDGTVEVQAFSLDAATGERVPHNTITPIARLKPGGIYELDLVLRNNRTSQAHPDGIFHPHAELHHIKKENIGLIEVMGLAVLPGRLKSELAGIGSLLSSGQAAEEVQALEAADHPLHAHAQWVVSLVEQHGRPLSPEEAEEALLDAVGDKFQQVLEHAGVFKRTEEGQEAFARFLQAAGLQRV